MTRTPNTLAAHRLVWAAGDSGQQDNLVERLFRASFAEGRDISDRGVLAGVARAAGLPRDAAADAWENEQATAGVREQEARAYAVGLRGVPHYVIANRHAFSGAVATEDLVKLLRRVAVRHRAAT
jgi:predicted DsbA family dithiol-disulfide isomerase